MRSKTVNPFSMFGNFSAIPPPAQTIVILCNTFAVRVFFSTHARDRLRHATRQLLSLLLLVRRCTRARLYTDPYIMCVRTRTNTPIYIHNYCNHICISALYTTYVPTLYARILLCDICVCVCVCVYHTDAISAHLLIMILKQWTFAIV